MRCDYISTLYANASRDIINRLNAVELGVL